MRGTRTTITASWFQNLLMLIAWVAGIGLLVFAASRIANQVVAAVIAVAVLGLCWTVTFRIMRNPAGRQRVEITTYEGLRGSFRIYQAGLYLLLVPAIGLSSVLVRLVGEQVQPALSLGTYLLVGIGVLIALGWPLALIVGRVHYFRVDADGQLWISHWGREEPLNIQEFAQVRGYVVQGRRAVIPSKVVCSGGRGRLRQVVFTLDHVVARDQHTRVPAGVLNAFLQDACERSGWSIQSVGSHGTQGWVTSKQMRSLDENR